MTKPSKVLILDLTRCLPPSPSPSEGEGAQARNAFDVMLRGVRS